VTSLPPAIDRLVCELRQLPGIGPRTAERLALHLVQTDAQAVTRLAGALVQCREAVRLCSLCGGLTESDPCVLCTDARRDTGLLCLVERPTDILSLEKSGAFHGRYHVLGGNISPINGIGPEDLRIVELEQRLARESIREIIVALGTDVEGDATSHYLARRIARPGLTISRIAHGLPAGSGLEFADDLTLSSAIEGRRTVS
jgi:recombination protein RecR